MKTKRSYHIRLTYKEGCGELWVQQRIRTRYPFVAIVSERPHERVVEFFADCGTEDRLRMLYREPWVADMVCIGKLGQILADNRQLFRSVPVADDMEKPFPGHRR